MFSLRVLQVDVGPEIFGDIQRFLFADGWHSVGSTSWDRGRPSAAIHEAVHVSSDGSGLVGIDVDRVSREVRDHRHDIPSAGGVARLKKR